MHSRGMTHSAELQNFLAAGRPGIDSVGYKKSEGRRKLLDRPGEVTPNSAAISHEASGTGRYTDPGKVRNVFRRLTDNSRIQSALRSQQYLRDRISVTRIKKMSSLQFELFSNLAFHRSVDDDRLLRRTNSSIVKTRTGQYVGDRLFDI